MLEKSILLSTESKNSQTQLLNERAEPKLASYEPEGGKGRPAGPQMFAEPINAASRQRMWNVRPNRGAGAQEAPGSPLTPPDFTKLSFPAA